jgi:hypothetical protein
MDFGFGGKGIRTPGLLIANETLYQLSYTPRDGERKLSRCRNLSAREKTADNASAQQTEAGGQAYVNTWRFGVSGSIEARA